MGSAWADWEMPTQSAQWWSLLDSEHQFQGGSGLSWGINAKTAAFLVKKKKKKTVSLQQCAEAEAEPLSSEGPGGSS